MSVCENFPFFKMQVEYTVCDHLARKNRNENVEMDDGNKRIEKIRAEEIRVKSRCGIDK